MRRVDSIQAISGLVSRLKGRKIGNLYWMSGELKDYIDRGLLYCLPARCGLALALEEQNRRQFCFQTDAEGAPSFECGFPGDRTYVAELVFSASGSERVAVERRILSRLGFAPGDEVLLMTAAADCLSGAGGAGDDRRIVPAEAENAPAVEALYRQAFELATDNPPVGEQLLAEIAHGRVRLLVGGDGRICGCVLCDTRGRTTWLRHVVVDAQMRGQGLGLALVRSVAETLPRHSDVRLWVKRGNTPAVKLYDRLGFAEGRLRMEIWKRETEPAAGSSAQ